MGVGAQIGFAEESSQELNRAAAITCTASLLPTGSAQPSFITVNGCPACGHPTHDTVPLEIVGLAPAEFVRRGAVGTALESERLRAAFETPETKERVFRATAVRCNCSEAHAGAGKRTGCGRFWSMDVSLSGSVAAVDNVPSAADLARISALKGWSVNELPNVRRTASAWQAGFAGLIALVSAVLLIKGPESVQDLVGWARIVLVVILGVALLLAITGSLFALLAANGLPGRVRTERLDPLVSAHNEAVVAADRLRFSIIAAVAATVLMAVAVGVSWFGVSDSGQHILVTFSNDDDPVCGAVIESSGDEKLTVLVANGDVRSFPLSDVNSIAPTDDCVSG